MPSRRRLLAATAGGLSLLAGCGCPGDPSSGFEAELSLRGLSRVTTGWHVELLVSTSFHQLDEESTGFPELFVGAYDPQGRLISVHEAGSFTWGDVPEEERESQDCGGGEAGSITRPVHFVTSELPHAIGLAFPSDSQPPEQLQEFDDLYAPVYDGDLAGRNWPPETATPKDYRRAWTDQFPWPALVDTEVDLPSSVHDVSLEPDRFCTLPSRRSPELRMSTVSITIEWSRPVPRTGPNLPLVQSVERTDRQELHCTIGLHSIPQEPDRGCDFRGYRVHIEHEERQFFSSVIVEHTDTEGRVIESRDVYDDL